MAKINKALDLNKLFEIQEGGKQLKKRLSFPLYAGVKYDGNYTVIMKRSQEDIEYISSGGHTYGNKEFTIFELVDVPPGVYFAERIAKTGKLGDRRNCALRGTRGKQIAYGHQYMVFDYVTLEGYEEGISVLPYKDRRDWVKDFFGDYWAADMLVYTQEELESLLKMEVKKGWEGLMLKSPNWYWKDTKSRTIEMCKYKKRRTADLKCVGITEGTGKYEGMVGALILQDSNGREVSVGSGLDDWQRSQDYRYFADMVVEIEFEQILDTYIQPTFICIRLDKHLDDID